MLNETSGYKLKANFIKKKLIYFESLKFNYFLFVLNMVTVDRPTLRDHQFIQNLIFYCGELWYNTKLLLVNVGAYDFIDRIALLSIKHPYFAISVAIGIIAFLLPLIIVLVFVLSTIFMAFTGFVLIEGTLVTIASVILFGCLGAILIIFTFFGLIIIVGYFGFMHAYDLHNNLNQQTAIKKFLITEKKA